MFSRRLNYLFSIALLLPALLAAQQRVFANAPEKPIVSGNVSIQLPAGWKNGAGGVLSAIAPQPDKDASGSFQASLSIRQDPGTKIDPAAQQAAVAKGVEGYQATEPPEQYVTTSGLQGVRFGGTFKKNNAALRSRQYMFNVNGQIYTITFTCLNSRWGAYQGALDAAVATFTLKR